MQRSKRRIPRRWGVRKQGDGFKEDPEVPRGWSSKKAWWETRRQVGCCSCGRDLGSFRHKGKPGEGFEWWEDWFDLILKHQYDRCVENT